MPKRLPIRDLVVGLLRGILRAVRYWLHYTLVALAWLGIVPLTACQYNNFIYLFDGIIGVNPSKRQPLFIYYDHTLATELFELLRTACYWMLIFLRLHYFIICIKNFK